MLRGVAVRNGLSCALSIAGTGWFLAVAEAQLHLQLPLPPTPEEDSGVVREAGNTYEYTFNVSMGPAPQTKKEARSKKVVSPRRLRGRAIHLSAEDLLQLDEDGDLQLSRSELQKLDDTLRRRVLRTYDMNFDNQLSRFEMPPTREEISNAAALLSDSSQIRRQQAVPQNRRQAYSNLRRFQLGSDRRVAPLPRPFYAEAARFGSGGGLFTPPTTRKPFSENPRPRVDWSLRVSSAYTYPLLPVDNR